MPTKQPRTHPADPDETRDIHDLIQEVVPDAKTWSDTENPHFNWRKPIDLIGTPDEPLLRNMLRAAKNGMFS